MVRIGEVFWEAKVTGVSGAAEDAEQLQSSMSNAGEAAIGAAAAQDEYKSSTVDAAESTEEAERWTNRLQMGQGLLASAAYFAASSLGVAGTATTAYGLAMRGATAATTAFTLATGGATTAAAYLSGAIGTIMGYGSGFVSWLAAGSAGALAFGAALGFGIGLLGTWILEVTGALDAVQNFGAWTRDVLPGWVADGLLQLISVAMGPLAVFGGLILGFVRGGFDEAFATAGQIIQNFMGAWKRQMKRLGNLFDNAKKSVVNGWNDIKQGAKDMADGVANYVSGTVRSAWNGVVPESVSLPSHTLSAPDWAGGYSRTIGGQTLNLPQLNTGGRIQESGAAVVHRGEEVVQSHVVEQLETSRALMSEFDPSNLSVNASGGGGGGDTNVENDIDVSLDASGFDPSSLSNSDLRSLARMIADELGGTTGNIPGGK